MQAKTDITNQTLTEVCFSGSNTYLSTNHVYNSAILSTSLVAVSK